MPGIVNSPQILTQSRQMREVLHLGKREAQRCIHAGRSRLVSWRVRTGSTLPPTPPHPMPRLRATTHPRTPTRSLQGVLSSDASYASLVSSGSATMSRQNSHNSMHSAAQAAPASCELVTLMKCPQWIPAWLVDVRHHLAALCRVKRSSSLLLPFLTHMRCAVRIECFRHVSRPWRLQADQQAAASHGMQSHGLQGSQC